MERIGVAGEAARVLGEAARVSGEAARVSGEESSGAGEALKAGFGKGEEGLSILMAGHNTNPPNNITSSNITSKLRRRVIDDMSKRNNQTQDGRIREKGKSPNFRHQPQIKQTQNKDDQSVENSILSSRAADDGLRQKPNNRADGRVIEREGRNVEERRRRHPRRVGGGEGRKPNPPHNHFGRQRRRIDGSGANIAAKSSHRRTFALR